MIKKLLLLIEKYDRPISSLGFVLGLILTPLTLTRVDMPIENLWIIIHLLIAIIGIIILNYFDNKFSKNLGEDKKSLIHFWLTIIVQFAYGNLFCTYFVFYFRSSDFFLTWPFLFFIFFLLLGNEIWKKHYSRLTLQLSTLFLAVYMFAIFGLPVLFHKIGDVVFIMSGIYSLLFIVIFSLSLRNFTKENFQKSKRALIYSIGGIFMAMNLMYFLNIIPPIPLSLKNSGIYHGMKRDTEGNYFALSERNNWQEFFKQYKDFNRFSGEPVFVYSAVFSPTKLDTEIFHQWQYFDEKTKTWKDSSKIEIAIVGGREGGYRAYSVKQNIFAGLWRVDVKNTSGQIIGRIKFNIKDTTIPEVTESILIK